ncbi:hypothetical protein V6574_19260 [Streptomyces sp. SM1P]
MLPLYPIDLAAKLIKSAALDSEFRSKRIRISIAKKYPPRLTGELVRVLASKGQGDIASGFLVTFCGRGAVDVANVLFDLGMDFSEGGVHAPSMLTWFGWDATPERFNSMIGLLGDLRPVDKEQAMEVMFSSAARHQDAAELNELIGSLEVDLQVKMMEHVARVREVAGVPRLIDELRQHSRQDLVISLFGQFAKERPQAAAELADLLLDLEFLQDAGVLLENLEKVTREV